MSWLARSIANTLRLDDDERQGDECRNDVVNRECSSQSQHGEGEGDSAAYEEIDLDDRRENDDAEDYIDDENHPGRGVKEDLSELGEALSRQLWGVASFLAPPPSAGSVPGQNSGRLESDRVRSEISDLDGFGRESEEEEDGDFVECENFTEYEVEDNVGDAVGVTEEALGFSQNIAHHPETWLDFPLSEDEEFDDFEISETQLKHVVAIECLVPRLLALRIELCPAHMSEAYFWMVYFVLLHSRLNKHDAELLSTPQLVQARAMWIKELQKQMNPQSDWSGVNTFHSKETTYLLHEDFDSLSSEDTHSRYTSNTTFAYEHPSSHDTIDVETEKHPIETSEIQFIDKAVIAEDLANKTVEKVVVTTTSYKSPILDYEDDDEDDWLKDNPELEGYSGPGLVGNEEDVSFSDLEDDIDCTAPTKTMAIPPEHLKFGQVPNKI